MRLMRIRFAVCCLALIAAVWPGAAFAAGRHALVIGVNDYQLVTPLKKAVGDAEAMRDTLSRLGFDVDLVLNPTRRQLNRAISDFQLKIQPGDVALVHFSGHGVEINGQNYLLPADIPKPRAGESDFLEAEALSLQDLVSRISSAGATTRIFIIDACRDNPFDPTGSRSLGGSRGLARVEAPKGTFILYSAGYHETALDGLNDNDPAPTSVYTRVLAAKLSEPGVPISAIAKEVRSNVEKLAKSVGHEQRPAYYDELSGDFFFAGAAAPAKPGATPALTPAPVVASAGPGADAEAFKAAQSIDTVGAWQIYLKRFPSGFYSEMARAALAKLQTPAPEPQPEPAPTARGVDMVGRIRDFIVYDYIAGDISDPGHLVSMYADTVDYYGLGRVPVSAIIADKAQYDRKWPRHSYELVPDTFRADPASSDGSRFFVTFHSTFRVSNGSKTLSGTSENRLIVDVSSGQPRIVDEKSSVISRR